MTHRPISAPRSARSMFCCLPPMRLVWIWAVIALGGPADAAWHRFPRLRARAAARRRRRSHRGHRQCRPQADAGGQAAGLGRPVLLARPFACRDRSRSRRSRRRRSRCRAASSEFKSIGSVIGTGASAFFLLAIAADQSRHPARRLAEFSARAARRAGRRAGAGSSALRPRLSRPHLSAAVPHGVAQLADVSDRLSVRPRLRHRDRDQPVHRRREPGFRRHDVRHRHDLPGACSPPA